jgi:hypothetical protein
MLKAPHGPAVVLGYGKQTHAGAVVTPAELYKKLATTWQFDKASKPIFIKAKLHRIQFWSQKASDKFPELNWAAIQLWSATAEGAPLSAD